MITFHTVADIVLTAKKGNTKRGKKVSVIKSPQASDMTVLHRDTKVESTYSSVVIIFVLAIALSKADLNWYVSAVIHQYTCTLCISNMFCYMLLLSKMTVV